MGIVSLPPVSGNRFDCNVLAINRLSIEIPDQESLVFVGLPGCGKTTSLRLLAGLEELTKGNIHI